MENQHRIIKGYRDLTPEEIALINKIKVHGIVTAALVAVVDMHLKVQKNLADGSIAKEGDYMTESERILAAEPSRWLAIGRTHMQEGVMALTRAVAQPEFF
jgi:hypothetical protein